MATDTPVYEGEVEGEGELTMIDPSLALSAQVKAEIDIQITTAKRFPRSIARFRKQAMELATIDEETAATMFYVMPRGGKKIEGPSVRLAELVGSTWGNLRYGARVVAIGDNFLTAEGVCHDLETNNAARVEIQRRITDSRNKRYNDDMIGVTANAACSIALRQAVFKIVPFSFIKPIYQAAKLCSIGKAKSMSEKRHAAIDWFKKAGATEKDVLNYLARNGMEEITDDDLITLRGLVTAIKDGDTTIEEALEVSTKAGGKVGPSDLNAKINGKEDPEPVTDAHGEIIEQEEGEGDADSMAADIANYAQLALANGCPEADAKTYGRSALEQEQPADWLISKPWAKKKASK